MIDKFKDIEDIVKYVPKNSNIIRNVVKAYTIINSEKYNKALCSISGGSDSDVMLDIIYKCDKFNKVDYVWFNTGVEYKATKDHLKYLEDKYGIKIIRERAIKSIPQCCKEYGQPVISKGVSQFIHRLQIHNFQWEDEPLEVLNAKYPKCHSALKWWTNTNDSIMFNVDYHRYLKEFMILNPPTFKISDSCCTWAKKKVVKNLIKSGKYDLNIMGVRKAEGGSRAFAYDSCFDDNNTGLDNYRPLFWFTDKDKMEYEKHCNIVHSDCYTKYGFKRTGCCCCPFAGRKLQEELALTKGWEPNLYNAAIHIFKDSYAYMEAYHEFRDKQTLLEKKKKYRKLI